MKDIIQETSHMSLRLFKWMRWQWDGQKHKMTQKCIQNFNWEISGKKPIGKPRRRWENSIHWNHQEI